MVARKGYYTDLAAWAAKQGFARLRVDGAPTPTAPWPRLDRFREHTIELPVAELTVSPRAETALRAGLQSALGYGKGVVHVLPAGAKAPEVFSVAPGLPQLRARLPRAGPAPLLAQHEARLVPRLLRDGPRDRGLRRRADRRGDLVERVVRGGRARRARPAPAAGCGRRRWRCASPGSSIADLLALPVESVETFIGSLKLDAREAAIARDLLAEVGSRLAFLRRVGLGYLQLDRAAPTLSGGEAQRIRLAAQLGSSLRGVCYILDEPTIGLHARDNRLLLATLKELGKAGNTVVVVEHDEETIRAAEHIVDLGPGAGVNGGRVVAAGTLRDLLRSKESVTGRFLREPLAHPLLPPRTGRAAGVRSRCAARACTTCATSR